MNILILELTFNIFFIIKMDAFNIYNLNIKILKYLLNIDNPKIINNEFEITFSVNNIFNNYTVINHFIEYYKLYFYLNKLKNFNLIKTKQKIYNVLILIYKCTSNDDIKKLISNYINISNIKTFNNFFKLSIEEQDDILNSMLITDYLELYHFNYFIYCFTDFDTDIKDINLINPNIFISDTDMRNIIDTQNHFIETDIHYYYFSISEQYYLNKDISFDYDTFLKIDKEYAIKLQKHIYVSYNYISGDESD